MSGDQRIDLVRDLFAAWSSGDADAPAPFFHEDGVLEDIVGGRHEGWPVIRDFFAKGLERWPDLVLEPEEFWTNDRGVACRWTMTATVRDEASFGADAVGQQWSSPGMSWVLIEDGRVRYEVDYHDRGAPAATLAGETVLVGRP